MQSPQTPSTVSFTIDSVQPGMLAFPDSPDLYRIRVQPAHTGAGWITIKYLTAPNSSKALTGPGAHNRRYNDLAFDRVPAGDWIVGRLAIAEEEEEEVEKEGEEYDDDNTRMPPPKLKFATIEPETEAASVLMGLGLYSAEPTWCSSTVDDADCQYTADDHPPRWTTIATAAGDNNDNKITVPKPIDLQCMDYPSASIIPAPRHHAVTDAPDVVRVSDWLPGHWAGIEQDVRAYEIIQSRDPGLSPRFLAHITENRSRVIGFLLERVADAREAGPGDLEPCRAALARLHALGIVKGGPLRRHSFLVRSGGAVLIQGPFAGALDDDDDGGGVGNNSGEVMRAEMESLEEVLAQSPSVFEDQSARMLRLVDPQRMKLLEEFEGTHGLVVPFVYWLESRQGGGHITLTVEQHGILAREYEENGFCWTRELQEKAERRFGPSAESI